MTSQKRRVWLLLAILLVAGIFRFHRFTQIPPGLDGDEAMEGNDATEAVKSGVFRVFYPEDNGREGLYVNLVALVLKAARVHEPWVIRLPAQVAGVLTVAGLYFLASELFDSGIGLLAAFFLATSFWHINFSRIGYRAILAPLFLTWASWLLLKAFRAPAARAWVAYSVAAGIVYSLGFYTYIAFRVTPLVLLVFAPFFLRTAQAWFRAMLFLTSALLAVLPLALYFVANPASFLGRMNAVSVGAVSTPVASFAVNSVRIALMLNFWGDENWRHNLSGRPELAWPVGILFFFGVLWLLSDLIRNARMGEGDRSFPAFLTLWWLLVGGLPSALSSDHPPHALRAILMVVPAVTIAAVGGMRIFRMAPVRLHAAVATAGGLFLVLCAALTWHDYFDIWAQRPEVAGVFNSAAVELGRHIDRMPATAPKYVLVEGGGYQVFAGGLPVPIQPTMFVSDTWTLAGRAAKNVHYLLAWQAASIPQGTPPEAVMLIRLQAGLAQP